jgi:UDP-glucose 4-epimerase
VTADFIFADDLIRAVRRAAIVTGIGGQIFQIANAKETTITELAELVAKVLADHGLGGVEIHRAAAGR